MKQEHPKVFHRVSAVSQMFDMSRSGTYKLIQNGDLDAVRIGSSIRVPAESIEKFKARKMAEGLGG
jgi:excisionase family DNA binding protein